VRRGWFVAAGAFTLLFAGTAFLSSKLPLLDALGPGPGFFPMILAILGLVLTAALVVGLVRGAEGPDASSGTASDDLVPDRAAMMRIAGLIVLLVAAFTALDPLGYRLTAFFFIALVLLLLGVRNYLAILAVALILSFGVFHGFFYWLKVPLPIGGLGL